MLSTNHDREHDLKFCVMSNSLSCLKPAVLEVDGNSEIGGVQPLLFDLFMAFDLIEGSHK